MIARCLFLFAFLFVCAGLQAGKTDLLDRYTEVARALAADDLKVSQTAAEALQNTAGEEQPALAELAGKVATSDSLEAARAAFKPLSAQAVKLADGAEGYFIMTCPMAKADWVQKERELANPYYGASMLRCGTVKK